MRAGIAQGLKALDQLIATVESGALSEREKTDVLHELRVKRVQFNDALVEALGLRVEARIENRRQGGCSAVWAPGCTARVLTKAINEGKTPVTVTDMSFSATGMSSGSEKTGGAGSAKLDAGRPLESSFEMNQGARIVQGTTTPVTRPYFTRKSLDQAYYDVSDPALRLAPETPAVSFWIRTWYDAVPLLLGHIVCAPKSRPGDHGSPARSRSVFEHLHHPGNRS